MIRIALSALLATTLAAHFARAETLYNGIELPKPWPPKIEKLSREPMEVPYLKNPPKIISIDIGRQLFVDDFLIESQTNLARTFHTAQWYEQNPVLKPDGAGDKGGAFPTAMVFSDGVWFDPKDSLYKIWYMAGHTTATAYATSKDGIHWDKPDLDIKKGTNLVNTKTRDSATIWLDQFETDPARRFKMFRVGDKWLCNIYFSADGIHFGDPVALAGPSGDRSTVFYNPFRKVWVYSIRADYKGARVRRYHEHGDVLEAAKWKSGEPTWWVGADDLDPQREDLKTPCQLYNLDAVGYESIMLGAFTIWRGQPKDRAKPNNIVLAYSRDGFHWHRPDRRPLVGPSEKYGDWNWGNVQSAGGVCLIVGDKLYFYTSGRAGVPGTTGSGVCSTGLAFLRRDGFASMDAGQTEGTLTTRPLTFKGKHLFVNADAAAGEIRAEILDQAGNVIEPFTQKNCIAVKADKTLAEIDWPGKVNMSVLADQVIRIRFTLKNAQLYSFWITPDANGASHGYVAAGGPGFTGATDTVGVATLAPPAK